MRTRWIFAAGFAALSSMGFSQSQALSLAGDVGLYWPSSTAIKNLVGSQFITYGVTPWAGNSAKGGITPEFDFIEGSGNGNSFLLVPVVLAYEKDFTSSYSTGIHTGTSFVPYLRLSGGVAYFDYNITTAPGHNYSLQRLGSTAGLEGGLKIANSAKVYVKYNLFSVEQGFNFSGLQVGIIFSLFKA